MEFNKKVATKTTSADGTITFENLRIGKYKIYETSTNEWYYLDTTKREVEIETDKTTNLTISNIIKKAYISINKEDLDIPEIKVDGAVFEIKDEDGTIVDTLTTDENGFAKSKELPIDKKYTVYEKIANERYLLNESEQNVTFVPADEGTTKNLLFKNKIKEGHLKIHKVDYDNPKFEMGAVEFDLYSYELDKIIGHYKTDVNGEISIKNLRIRSL